MCNNTFDDNRSDIMDREQQINELQKVICQHCFEMTQQLKGY
nr:MAG TPA: putative zinc-ribbon domain protein [Caudoviricetes sp.]